MMLLFAIFAKAKIPGEFSLAFSLAISFHHMKVHQIHAAAAWEDLVLPADTNHIGKKWNSIEKTFSYQAVPAVSDWL